MSELEVMVLADGILRELGEPPVKTYELQIQFGLPSQYPAQDLPVKDFLEALLNARALESAPFTHAALSRRAP